MRTRTLVAGMCLCVWIGAPARAERLNLTHSPWEMHDPERVQVSGGSGTHGDPRWYQFAPAIPEPGMAWKVLDGAESGPPNPVDIDYLGPNHNYSSNPRTSLTTPHFTSFH